MMTYTVVDDNGAIEGRGLSVAEAAAIVLGADGHRWEVRQVKEYGFRLYRSLWSENHPIGAAILEPTHAMTTAATRAAADQIIFSQVICYAEEWRGFNGAVMTDAAYDHAINTDCSDHGVAK